MTRNIKPQDMALQVAERHHSGAVIYRPNPELAPEGRREIIVRRKLAHLSLLLGQDARKFFSDDIILRS